MATEAQCKDFISKIAPLVQKYSKQYGYKVSSPIIAQACLESAYGTSSLGYKYHNYFGMKCGSNWNGKSVNLATKEEYKVGQLTDIKANFRAYDSMEEGVKGYFEFISKSRYANLKTATTAEQYLTMIKNDGYATSSKYVTNNMTVVNKYNLTKYDKQVSYYPKYSETLDNIFKIIGVPDNMRGSAANRKPIAEANGISNYSGTAEQNKTLIDLAKKGTLIKP